MFPKFENVDINSYINSYTNSSEKAEPATTVHHIERFLNLEYRFAIPKSWTRLAEKREEEREEEEFQAEREEQEHRQFQSILSFSKRKI